MKSAKTKLVWLAVALVAVLVGVAATTYAGSSYRIDTVSFVAVAPTSTAAVSSPNLRIDTGLKISGLFGGTITSVAPYALGFDYTDATSTIKEAEIAKVVVTYGDGETEPAASSLKLPLRIPARPFESVNSVAGGRIVKTESRVISDAIPGLVRRAAPVAISIEGHFLRDDGTRIPFSLHRAFEAVRDRGTKSWFEIMSGC